DITSFFLFLSRHFVVAYLCCTSFSPPSAKFSCSKSYLGLDFFFAGFRGVGSRPFGATQHRCWKEQLGGASEDERSYGQGRFAACAFVGGFL
ncbi:MAG: hypothetical protein UIE84_00950, partial [Christensenellales bacterium]|nr:hypothetical protein [Christensenellales bacterium]